MNIDKPTLKRSNATAFDADGVQCIACKCKDCEDYVALVIEEMCEDYLIKNIEKLLVNHFNRAFDNNDIFQGNNSNEDNFRFREFDI